MKLESLMMVPGKDKEQGFCEVHDSGKKASIQCIGLQRILQRLFEDTHLKGKPFIIKVSLSLRIYKDY